MQQYQLVQGELKLMFCKEGLFFADPANAKSSHFIYMQPDQAPGHINKMTRLSVRRISVKNAVLEIYLF